MHPFLLTAWLAQGMPANAAGPPTDPTVLADRAVAANPSIAAMEDHVRDLEARASVAGVWTDPMVSVEYSNVPWNTLALDQSPMSGIQFVARQTIPFPGVPHLRKGVARAGVKVGQAARDEMKVQLRGTVEQAYWKLTLVRQLREVTERHVRITRELLGAVEARYEVGRASQSDLLRLQVLRDQLSDDLNDYDQQERTLLAALAAALHEPDLQVATPDETRPVAVQGDTAAWLAVARHERPALLQLEAQKHLEEQAARLARLDAAPDFTIWGGYRLRSQTMTGDANTSPSASGNGAGDVDFVSTGLSLAIPLASGRQAAGFATAHTQAANQAANQKAALIDRIRSDLEAAVAAWKRAEQKARVYRDNLLPAAQTALDATLADYRVDKAEFASLYQAELELLNLERALRTATVATHIEEVAARTAAGGPLTQENP